MNVSIASGKGGTGKTTIAVNLALALGDVQLLDCDVEEPNCHIFLDPEINEAREVFVDVPEIDFNACDYCGKCAEFCQYNALAVAGDTLLEFNELCHGCGGCMKVCPKNAITEKKKRVGVVKTGVAGEAHFSYGLLDVGQAMATPVINYLKKQASQDKDTLIDAPPGTSCAVIESVKDSDYCILVTEPTPFGLNDLKLAVEMLETLCIPHGVIVNRDGVGDDRVDEYCMKKDVPILLKIPHDEEIARLYSEGIPFTKHLHEYAFMLKDMYARIRGLVE